MDEPDFGYDYELIKKYRRDLHQIPEIGFDLSETSKYINSKLIEMGYQTITTAKVGIIAIKKGINEEAICFRSDMDGLRVYEMTQLDFKSKHEGSMHACGHDGHMAILLGLAYYLSKVSPFKKTIVLLFQPAEEGPGGAKVVLEEKILEGLHVKAIFGLHIFPEIKEGKIGLVKGPMMAQSGEFTTTIYGKSSHGGEPHLGHDAILATSEVVTLYHSIVSRYTNPLYPNVLTIGTIHGGDACNIIANKVIMTGTIRSFDENQYRLIKERMEMINLGIGLANDVKIISEIRDFYPPVINDDKLYEKVFNSLDNDLVEIIQQMMLAEDFSYYQKEIPGLFVMLGCKNENLGFVNSLHSCYFNFDEKVLLSGLNYFKKICEIFANQ